MMRKIISCLLILLTVCVTLSGCGASPSVKELSASESLEALFTTIDLMDATISDLQSEMEAGNVTSEQLTQMYIDRIEAYDEKLDLNSIIAINPEALDDARALDQERSEGQVRGPLHGIPIVVKANYDVTGMATSAGANILADLIADDDAFVVKQLRDAGAVILAQANLSEFAYSSLNSRSTLGGYTHNAYDTARTPGGSSGGSAVAVTCNFAAAGLGTDTGGSIRNPSSFSNIYGMRPSKGLTSIDGVFPLAAYRDTTGPMARTAEDLALILETMAGTDPADDYTVEADADALLGSGYTDSLSSDSLKGMRIGTLGFSLQIYGVFDEDNVFLTPNVKIEQMLQRAIANLTKAGAEIVDLSEFITQDMLDEYEETFKAETFQYDVNKFLYEKGSAAKYKTLYELMENGVTTASHMNLLISTYSIDEFTESFEETPNPYSLEYGSYQRIPAYEEMLDARAQIMQIMAENDVDAIMYLNYFDVPKKDEHYMMSPDHNAADYDMAFGPRLGLPEINIPMGFSGTDEDCESELPLGLSLFAGFGQEETLLQIAYAYEQQAGDIIRRAPEIAPALEDKALNEFLLDLIDRAYAIDFTKYKKIPIPEGRVQIMLDACEDAMDVDMSDPYAVYEAARNLAEAYDRVLAVLNG